LFIAASSSAAPGLAPRTKYEAYQRTASSSRSIDGARCSTNLRVSGIPHSSALGIRTGMSSG
jgi:hypothetical protein